MEKRKLNKEFDTKKLWQQVFSKFTGVVYHHIGLLPL